MKTGRHFVSYKEATEKPTLKKRRKHERPGAPARLISLALTAVMLLMALPAGLPALAERTPSDWALIEMNEANTSGLLTPSAARDFHDTLTRDEFCELVVVMVEQTLGSKLPIPEANPFVDDADPVSIHALKAWQYGIITGVTQTLFAPLQKVERQQICSMMIRAIRRLENDLNRTILASGIATLPYRDAAQFQDYAVEPAKLAYTNGIMRGDDQGNFFPESYISSQECVAAILRSYKVIEDARLSGMSTAQILNVAEGRVHIGFAYGDTMNGVSQHLTLPAVTSGGATVSWTSSNISIIGINGTTGYVFPGTYPQTVKLTATIRLGNSTRVKEFNLTTSPLTGERLLLENAYNELDIVYINEGDDENNVTGRIGIPTTVLGVPVVWHSNAPAVVSTAGIVNVPNSADTRAATLTAVITVGTQTRTKIFNLTVVNPAFSRGVTLHSVMLGMTQNQVAQQLGVAQSTIQTSNNETWVLYHNDNYSNFVTVAFISNRVVAVYSMAVDAANQLRNRSGALISIQEANAVSGVGAISYVDPGNSSRQYAIMIYDTASVIGTSRTLTPEGQERLLFELINAFRARNSRIALEWTDKLGTPARTHSSNAGSGNLQQRVTSGGFDAACYAGGNTVAGGNDAFDALNQIISSASGSSPMRTAILQSGATAIGTGFAGGHAGTFRTYFTFALGTIYPITGVIVTQQGTPGTITTINVASSFTTTVTLTMSPTGFNETFTVTSSNTGRVTVSGVTPTNTGANVTVTGVANGNANIIVTGNSSGKTYSIPVSVGTVYASFLVVSYSDMNTTLTSSADVAAGSNATASGSRTLVMGTNDTLTLSAATTNGTAVDWSRVNGSAANVSRSNTGNDGIVTATGSAGEVTLRARVHTGSNTYITHTFTVRVVAISSSVTVNPQTVNVGSDATASVTVSNLPTGTGSTPVYAWSSSGNQLTKTSQTPETTTATFIGANTGNSTITFTATWSASGSSTFLGRIVRTASVSVQGNLYADSITVSHTSVKMIPGQTFAVTAATVPTVISQSHSFAWSSSHTDFATVSGGGTNGATGTITAISAGTTIITVTLTQGSGFSRIANITVVVEGFPTIAISGPRTITAGGGFVQYTVTPSDFPSAYSLVWSYEGTGAVIDSASGMVAPTGEAGSGTITAELWYKIGNSSTVVTTATYNITINAAR